MSAAHTSAFSGLLAGAFGGPAALPLPHQWYFVRQRFARFLENLKITEDQAQDGDRKHRGVVNTLNRWYWNSDSETDHRELIGSWRKTTRVRPPRDIDLIFQLPYEVYLRYQQRSGNRQSDLLQEVKDALSVTYPTTHTRGDGQVVVIPFNTYEVEVVPGFAAQSGGYLICDANDGGRYKWVHPAAELGVLDATDRWFNGNVSKLTRMMKQWQRYCDVPVKSFQLEALIMEALPRVGWGGNDEFWFDWLVRDVLAHMVGRTNGSFSMPTTGETIFLGDAWLGKAMSAYERAVKACEYERANEEIPAGDEWQKIFGVMIPQTVG